MIIVKFEILELAGGQILVETDGQESPDVTPGEQFTMAMLKDALDRAQASYHAKYHPHPGAPPTCEASDISFPS